MRGREPGPGTISRNRPVSRNQISGRRSSACLLDLRIGLWIRWDQMTGEDDAVQVTSPLSSLMKISPV